jgi:predicted TIM-barrel fold metal-dependent hydrolase
MIIDTHTHIWRNPDELGPQLSSQMRYHAGEPFDQLDAGPAAHELAMGPVSMAFVLGYRSRLLGAHVPNDLIASHVRHFPERLVGIGSIDPMTDGYLDELAKLPTIGLAGVAVSPSEQGFHPAHTRAMRLYEKCQATGMPVIFHQAGPFAAPDARLEFAQPWMLDEIARSFPTLKLLITHCGHPFTDQVLILLGKHRNVFAELSGIAARPWQLYNVLLMAHQMNVTDRLLFGSNFPHLSPQQAIEAIYSLNLFTHGTGLTPVPRERLRSIIERDALACLGLRRPPAIPNTPSARPASSPLAQPQGAIK